MDTTPFEAEFDLLLQRELDYVRTHNPSWSDDQIRLQAEENVAEMWFDEEIRFRLALSAATDSIGAEFRRAMYATAYEVGGEALAEEVRRLDTPDSYFPPIEALQRVVDRGGSEELARYFEATARFRRAASRSQKSQVAGRGSVANFISGWWHFLSTRNIRRHG